MKRRNFSESFKAGAVKLVVEQGQTIAKAAKELGISESALHRWVKAEAVERGKAPGLTASEKQEIRELKRRVQVLEMERDILKKATAFFAKESR